MEQIAITLPPELSIACKLHYFLILSSPWERVILFFGDTFMSTRTSSSAVVSFDTEALIVVDTQDQVLGYGTKAELHRGTGTLHRAFSIFLFNARGEVLLQQRSEQKALWPAFWSNTCCSHPRRGETYEIATQRRLEEELGVAADLAFTHRFQYQAQYDAAGAEHELCSVYVGRIDRDPNPNPLEVADWRWIAPSALDEWLSERPETLTPWFKLEWEALRSGRYAQILSGVGLEWSSDSSNAVNSDPSAVVG